MRGDNYNGKNMQNSHIKLLVIHGWGASYLEAAEKLVQRLDVTAFWYQGSILVPSRSASLLRHLLNDPTNDPYYQSLCKLIISRFLVSPPLPEDQKEHIEGFSRFSEDRLRRDFPHFGIPVTPSARRICAQRLTEEAEHELQPVLRLLRNLQEQVRSYQGDRHEAAIRQFLTVTANVEGVAHSPIPLLEALREMHETGGDLDTIASAVLYAAALRQQAHAADRPFRYGHEYRFVFVNYHESLQALKLWGPAELYIADLPVAAFPALEEDIQHLHANGIHTARFEDHHPYDPDRKKTMQDLVDRKQIGFLWLSGPEQGHELPEEEIKCAADMVFESCIANTPAETAGARRLQAAAHGEDFVTNRTELGILLTNLIKGGICKVELAQLLLASLENDDAMQRLKERGWASLPDLWRATLDSTAEYILENAAILQLSDSKTRIVCAKAVHADPGMPKLPTGKAIEFLARSFPEAQYAFYCFGSSLMVARRLDQADTTLNLGALMPRIGTETDGGHAGAAVCRPDANPAFPRRLLGQISDANFISFARYLGDRLTRSAHPVANVRNVSRPGKARWTSGSRKLIWIVLIAFLGGLALMSFFPSFRPENVRQSNEEFLPQIDISEEADVIPNAETL